MKKFEESLTDLTKSLEIEPNDALALKQRGKIYCMVKKYEESLADLTKSLEIDPNDAWALSSRGKTYCMMGKYEESLADLNKSLKIEPNDAWALGSRGKTYYMMGKYEESLADLTKLLEIEPNDTWALKLCGEASYMMGEYEESLAVLTKSLKIKPNDSWALSSRGKTYCMMDKYEESLADLNKSLEIEPNNPQILSSRGITYRMMGRFGESLADLTKSLEIEPRDPWTLKHYEEMGHDAQMKQMELRSYYYNTDWNMDDDEYFACDVEKCEYWDRDVYFIIIDKFTDTTKVALKCLNGSSDSTIDFLKEVELNLQIADDAFFIQCMGISQDPQTLNYIMVMELASEGSLRTYLNVNYDSMSWQEKIMSLCSNSLFAGFIAPKLPSWKLHSEAIYTSRLLDTSNLPPPVNAPDFEKQLSKLVPEVLDDKQNILDMHDSKQVELTIPGGKHYII
nr:1338_t:CDS:2 [Entrophospora candida]